MNVVLCFFALCCLPADDLPANSQAILSHHKAVKPRVMRQWDGEVNSLANRLRSLKGEAKQKAETVLAERRAQLAQLKAGELVLFPHLPTPMTYKTAGTLPRADPTVLAVLGKDSLLMELDWPLPAGTMSAKPGAAPRATVIVKGIPTAGAVDKRPFLLPTGPYFYSSTDSSTGRTYPVLEPFDPAKMLPLLSPKK